MLMARRMLSARTVNLNGTVGNNGFDDLTITSAEGILQSPERLRRIALRSLPVVQSKFKTRL